MTGKTQGAADRAREMRAAGYTFRAIADELDVAVSTAHRWVVPESAELARAAARAWKAANPAANKERQRRYKESRHARGECESCGGPMAAGGRWRHKRCRTCISRAARQREAMVEALWNQGLPLTVIAEQADIPGGSVNSAVDRLRRQGRVGYRYAACQRTEVAA